MKLERIEVKNYRSLFHDYEAKQSFVLDLGDGVNAIAGPNNVGKSNVLRALSLALDPDFRFDRALDLPSPLPGSKPSVTLTFRVPQAGRPSREQTLIRRVDEYERKVNPSAKRTYADDGEIRLRVTIEGSEDSVGARREVFVVRGGGARSLNDDDQIARKALDSFHRCFHFVKIDSGQSLESLMEGNFRDILHNVLREDLRKEFESAEKSRSGYREDLQVGLLQKLAEKINDELKELFPEIDSVSLEPQVASLDETLAKMRVRVTDKAITDLADKGTGVRGGLIIAMLRHFAEVGKRSMLFAVEEPESFLHPAAQEQLREDLEALADRRDISLLVTTHSPYIVSRKPGSRVFGLDKDDDGRTVVRAQADGAEPHAGVLSGLYRDSLVMEWLDQQGEIPAGTRLIIVVEGETDRQYAELAVERAGRPELLEGIHFRVAGANAGGASGGAALAVMQAVVTHASAPVPAAVVLDNDAPGKEAAAILKQIGSKTKLWQEGKQLFTYRLAFESGQKEFGYEAEDLWPSHLAGAFVAENPEADKGRTPLPKPASGWHWDIAAPSKGQFVDHLDASATPEDCERWVRFIELVREGTGLGPPDVAAFEVARSAAEAAAGDDGAGSAEADEAWTPRRDFLLAVDERVRAGLVAAGLKPAAPHRRGAYIKVHLPESCGPYTTHHLAIRIGRPHASIAFIVNDLPTAEENLATLETLRATVETDLVATVPTPPSDWAVGQGDAIRALATSTRRGLGYAAGDADATAEWVLSMCLGWLDVLERAANADG